MANIESAPDWMNVGTGVDMSISELACVIQEVVVLRENSCLIQVDLMGLQESC